LHRIEPRTFLSYTECEATYLLGSFSFDPRRRIWDTRTWSKGEIDDAILIGSDTVVGSEEGDYNYQCVFKVPDFNGDALDDVGVRCQAIDEDKKVLEDTTLVYSVKNGQPVILKMTDRQQVAALTAKLCGRAAKPRFCQAN
jgi:hypothetical protein